MGDLPEPLPRRCPIRDDPTAQDGKAVVVIGADPPKSDIDIQANYPDLYRLAGKRTAERSA